MTGAGETMQRGFAAEPRSVGLARRAVADFATGLGMIEPRLGDLKTTVGEACANVVRHAYPAADGAFDVDARIADERLTVTIRDRGVGLRPVLETPALATRLGLGLIAVLADDYAIAGRAGGGTEVRITMAL